MMDGVLVPLLVFEAIAGKTEVCAVAGHPSQREDGAIACIKKEGLALVVKKTRLRAIITNRI